ncbi:hypothetical protein [Fervidobacterium thailandense]|uniref:VCBS repeat-containing protein n=1 Tax=Fervidobacterium thailandense TaxID=1008305 RepID=A0A1E3G3T9_9BACT|nr:hypothetical protein [Fervidobacterium thailandense]ODN30927.1 hypothetical protein A4H02_03465 [Fervidobacterium thailandense]
MRVDKYGISLEAENLSLKYSKVRQSILCYKTPDTLHITIREHRPSLDDKELMKLKILKSMLEKLTGNKLKLYLPKPTYSVEVSLERGQEVVEMDSEEENLEVQYSGFTARGFVKTKDGRTVEFSARIENFSLTYSYRRIHEKVVDPIVLELGGTESNKKAVEIDLNFDGQKERFFIGGGLGFLVYDRNGNGKVDSADELFGPRTGDGFAELARLDTDGDNWIDEDDIEFLKLKIWTVDENGREKLVGLLDLNVGAIFLGNVSTPFDYYDHIVRKSSIYLSESGALGVVKQIDLRV